MARDHKLTLRIPTEDVEKLRALAEETDRSINWLVGHMVDSWLVEHFDGARPLPALRSRPHKDQIALPLEATPAAE